MHKPQKTVLGELRYSRSPKTPVGRPADMVSPDYSNLEAFLFLTQWYVENPCPNCAGWSGTLGCHRGPQPSLCHIKRGELCCKDRAILRCLFCFLNGESSDMYTISHGCKYTKRDLRFHMMFHHYDLYKYQRQPLDLESRRNYYKSLLLMVLEVEKKWCLLWVDEFREYAEFYIQHFKKFHGEHNHLTAIWCTVDKAKEDYPNGRHLLVIQQIVLFRMMDDFALFKRLLKKFKLCKI